MGLAGVELLMAIEDRFGIAITDAEARDLSTVGDLHALIVRKLRRASAEVCLTSRTFYETRRALMALFGTPRAAVRLDTPLDDLLPRRLRARHWQQLQETLALQLPALCMSRWRLGLVLGALLVIVGSQVAVFLYIEESVIGLLIAPVIGLFSAAVLLSATARCAVHIPPECRTIRDLITTVITRHYRQQPTAENTWTDDQVWHAMLDVFRTELRHLPADIHSDIRLSDICQD